MAPGGPPGRHRPRDSVAAGAAGLPGWGRAPAGDTHALTERVPAPAPPADRCPGRVRLAVPSAPRCRPRPAAPMPGAL